jgi:hypothetical protein
MKTEYDNNLLLEGISITRIMKITTKSRYRHHGVSIFRSGG